MWIAIAPGPRAQCQFKLFSSAEPHEWPSRAATFVFTSHPFAAIHAGVKASNPHPGRSVAIQTS